MVNPHVINNFCDGFELRARSDKLIKIFDIGIAAFLKPFVGNYFIPSELLLLSPTIRISPPKLATSYAWPMRLSGPKSYIGPRSNASEWLARFGLRVIRDGARLRRMLQTDGQRLSARLQETPLVPQTKEVCLLFCLRIVAHNWFASTCNFSILLDLPEKFYVNVFVLFWKR